MIQRQFVIKSIARKMRGLRHAFNNSAQHIQFQSCAVSSGTFESAVVKNLVRRSTNLAHLNMSCTTRLSSTFTKPSKRANVTKVYEESDGECNDDEAVNGRSGSTECSDDSSYEPQEKINVPMTFHGTNSFSKRSHHCNELNLSHVGEQVYLYGWIEAKRGENFIILRDGYGSVQICLTEYIGEEIDSTVSPESVIYVAGTVVKRSAGHVNKEMATGEIEVHPTAINVISVVKKNLPFSLKGFNKPKENLGLKHRYLHLRFPEMQHTLRLRSNILHKMRRFLVEDCSFVEVETPTLFGKTPGGAQEFVVPTKNKGKCYSLVQSPQQFKQMLMVAGMDRYFQLARCYRDEDSRADRQPEFTQLDLELSFADMDGVMNLTEQILRHSWPEDQCGPLEFPFRRIKYSQAISDYGSDKPDLRYSTKIIDYSNFLTPYFQYRDQNNVRLMAYFKKGSLYTEELAKEVDKMVEARQSDRWPVTVKVFPYENFDSLLENLQPVLSEKPIRKIFSLMDTIQPGDLVVFGHGEKEALVRILGAIRVPIAKMCGIEPESRFSPLWVTYFPLLKKGRLIGQFKPSHHPFTNITKNSIKMFVGAPLEMQSLSYDLVINGVEIGGGSERIKDPEFQVKVLEKIGADPKDFEYFLNALSYGCPPHAGIALGVDRLLACILDADSIRDVIAFPKTFDGVEPLTGAPSTPSGADKARYKLK